ncbi:fungal-specific transcription factor domain-containing protein [Aspergillus heterothallicus]
MSPNSQPTRSRARVRAGKACTRCHEKRIKCDAMQHLPCTPCVKDGHAGCALRPTKRGTYTRSALGQKVGTEVLREGPAPGDVSGTQGLNHQVDAAPTLATDPGEPSPTPRRAVDSGHVSHPPVSESPHTQPSHGIPDTGSSSSYRDISWSAMFDHFLNNRENAREWIDKCSITYLGESFPLAIILNGLKDGSRPKLHHLGPPFPGAHSLPPFQSQPTHMLPEDLEYLRAKGVFQLPEKAHLDALFSVFLDRVYPLYPIVHRQEIMQEYKNTQLSLILTHAIGFIAVTFAPQTVLNLLGFDSRQAARSSFYTKAKALFDMGYETNKITILQSTFLLSFYGGGPNTYWNFYSWISTAVTIAEAIGIHRSTIGIPNMQPHDKSLMRRLWWALVVRDSICGTLVGRPFRIDLDQADADMLTIEDFAHDAPQPEFLNSASAQRYAQYQIETAQLSLIMRDIIISRFYPGRRPVRAEDLHAKLILWKSQLAPMLAWDAEVPDASNPFSLSLSVQYSNHLILTYLGHIRGENTCRRDEQEIEEIIDSAAHHIPTVACTLITKSALLSVPHELYHGIFLAQAAFYERMRSPNKLTARLGRSALNSCQMVLQTISEFWDCGTFIMQLFENLSSRCLEQQQQQSWTADSGQDSSRTIRSAAETSGVGPSMASVAEAGVFNALLGEDRWQGNPMLESLFDLPPELFLPE